MYQTGIAPTSWIVPKDYEEKKGLEESDVERVPQRETTLPEKLRLILVS